MPCLLPAIVPYPMLPFPVAGFVQAGNGEGKRRKPSDSRSPKREPIRRRTQRNRVLLFGRLRELALYRAEVLRAQGFTVSTPESKEEAAAIIRRGNFDIAILTYTLSSETVQELAELIREYCAECPLIAISNLGKQDREIQPDETVMADDGPRALIAALRRVAHRH